MTFQQENHDYIIDYIYNCVTFKNGKKQNLNPFEGLAALLVAGTGPKKEEMMPKRQLNGPKLRQLYRIEFRNCETLYGTAVGVSAAFRTSFGVSRSFRYWYACYLGVSCNLGANFNLSNISIILRRFVQCYDHILLLSFQVFIC